MQRIIKRSLKHAVTKEEISNRECERMYKIWEAASIIHFDDTLIRDKFKV